METKKKIEGASKPGFKKDKAPGKNLFPEQLEIANKIIAKMKWPIK